MADFNISNHCNCVVTYFAPNLSQLAKEKGEIKPPDSTSSQKYEHMLKDVGANSNSIVAVIKMKEPLSEQGNDKVEHFIKEIKKIDGVNQVISPYTNKDTFKKLSQKIKTIMIPVEMTTGDSVKVADKINKIDDHPGKVYLTNNDLVTHDINKATDKGLQKTEIVTVALILIILFVVFRSVVTPFIPLFIVGLSYLFSSAIIAFLVKYCDFPVSVYIQPF